MTRLRRLLLAKMDTDDYNTAKDCSKCPCISTEFKRQRRLELFLLAGFFEFVSIDIFGPLPWPKTEKQFIITDRCSKLMRAIPATKLILTQAMHIFS